MIFVIFLGRVLFVSMDTSLLRVILKIRFMESLKQNRKHTVHFTYPSLKWILSLARIEYLLYSKPLTR